MPLVGVVVRFLLAQSVAGAGSPRVAHHRAPGGAEEELIALGRGDRARRGQSLRHSIVFS